jgi:hypothetical protein
VPQILRTGCSGSGLMENSRARGGQLGTAGSLSLSTQGVHSVMPAEAAQLEMADLNDWFGNFDRESVGQ